MRTTFATVAACAALFASAAADAAPVRRLALLIANNVGGDEVQDLRYAERDAKKMQAVLHELGGYRPGDVRTLLGATAGEALAALDALEASGRRARDAGARTSLLVYYSGHAKRGALRLGDTRLDMHLLRDKLKQSAADIKIGIIDACESGAITRTKGGRRGPSFLFESDDREATRGLILISSSSEHESSQESDELGGSFFTHYLASGLRGDADDSGDRRVTLGEVYEYTYHKTVQVTASTRSGTQHPTYAYDLEGQGDIVLTDLSRGRSGVHFPEDLEGRFLLFDLGRDQVAAEIGKAAGEPRRIALPPGEYALKLRMTDHLRMARFELAAHQTYRVDPGDMERVAFEDDYAKGPALRAEIARGRARFSLEAAVAYQSFLSGAARRELFPALTLFGATGRVGPFLGGAHLQVDLLFGSRSDVRLDLGALTVVQDFFEAQVATALMWRLPLGPVALGAGPRLAGLYLRRAFPRDELLRTQDMFGLSPALAAEAQYAFGPDDSVVLGAFGRLGVLVYSVDDNRTLGFAEAGVFVGYRP